LILSFEKRFVDKGLIRGALATKQATDLTAVLDETENCARGDPGTPVAPMAHFQKFCVSILLCTLPNSWILT
jgi:hypothetical protein